MTADKLCTVELARRHLGLYDYRAFHIRLDSEPVHLWFGSTGATFIPSTEKTDDALGEYHRSLLMHDDPWHQVAGVASVIYWGHAGREDPNARIRVSWFLQGTKKQEPINPQRLSMALADVRHRLDEGDYGAALGALCGINQLGYTSFASKVLSFLAPDQTGVYDSKISEALNCVQALRRDFPGAIGALGPVSSKTKQARYHAWCLGLQKIAADLSNLEGKKVRAVDAERAIFQSVR